MSSTSTATAYILRGDFNDESRKHPGLKFFEEANKHFDSRDHTDYENFYAEDFGYHSTHGDTITHDDDAGYHDDHSFQKAASKYYMDPLDDHVHFNDETIILDAKNGGYDMVWMGNLFAHVKGEAGQGETKVKDPKGKEWDVKIPVSYHFDIVKDSSAAHGYKFASMKCFKDTHVVNDILEKRNHGHLKSLDT